jgi:hypothetical protein
MVLTVVDVHLCRVRVICSRFAEVARVEARAEVVSLVLEVGKGFTLGLTLCQRVRRSQGGCLASETAVLALGATGDQRPRHCAHTAKEVDVRISRPFMPNEFYPPEECQAEVLVEFSRRTFPANYWVYASMCMHVAA